MISYDNYKNRIMKLAKVKKFLQRYKFLIAGILTALIALSVGLMIGKGAFLSDMVFPQSITFDPYGRFEIKPAKSFLSSSKVEYSKDGESWSEEQPKRAGSYYARTAARRLSSYSYSRAVQFEILPIHSTFTVTGDSVVYGEIPQYTVTNLYAGHKVARENLEFEYADLQSSDTVVSAVEDSVKILGEDGEDLTYCYAVEGVGKSLKILSREIAVKPISQTLLYSGRAAEYDGGVAMGTLSRLAKGDTLTVDTFVAESGSSERVVPVNASDYVIGVDSVKIMHGDIDVTARYDISLLSAELKILRYPIATLTGSAEKVYDGQELSEESVVAVSGDLLAGHSFYFERQLLPHLTSVGARENKFDFEIVAADGSVVTENYAISKEWGTLRITPYELTITTPDRSRTYDGTPLLGGEYTAGKLLSGYTTECVNYATLTDVGSCENGVEIIVVKDGWNLTENFRFIKSFGTLTVTPRPLKVKTGTAQKVYDATAHSETRYDIVEGSLVAGHSLTVSSAFSVTDVTESRGVNNTTEYAVYSGDTDVSANYEIGYEYGKLTVLPRHIKVKTEDRVFVYDTAFHSHSGYTASLSSDEREEGLLGAELICVFATAVKEVSEGEVKNVCEYEAPNANYIIDNVEFGTLRVVPRSITVVTATRSKVYDGTPLTDPAVEETYYLNDGEKQEGLLDGALVPLTCASVTSVLEGENGSVENACTYSLPSSNYTIERVIFGTLTILPRRLIVTTATASKEYDGEPLSDSENYTAVWADDGKGVGLIGADKLVVRSETTVLPRSITLDGAEPVQNVCLYGVPNANYIIEETRYGTLKITPRNVLVTTATGSHIYDGSYFSVTEYEKLECAKSEGGKWVADNSRPALIAPLTELALKDGTQTEVRNVYNGATKNECEYDDDGGCYAIHYVYGTLTVLPRPVIVETHSNSWLFDGRQHSETGKTVFYCKTDENGNLVAAPEYEGLVDGDDLVLTEEFIVLNATVGGAVANRCVFSAPDSNYEIKATVYGTLTVRQRHISITTATTSWTYDGLEHSDGSYISRLTSDQREAGLVGGDKLVVDESTLNSITDCGTVTNEYAFTAPLFDGVHSNYIIDEANTLYGTLTVDVRTLYIKTATADKDYDGRELFADTPEKCYHINSDGKEEFGLAPGHRLEVDTLYGIINATGAEGMENRTTYKVVDGDGKPILNNYKIVGYIYGRLIINRATLIVAINNIGAVYGETVSAPDGLNLNDRYATVLNIAESESIYISTRFEKNGAAVQPKNVGAYDISLIEGECRIISDGRVKPNGMDNYTLIGVSGTLNIRPLQLLCTFDMQTVTYGAVYGTEEGDITEYITADEYGSGESTIKLPYGDRLIIYIKYYDLNDGNKTSVVPRDAGLYGITGGEIIAVGNDGGDANYSFAFVDSVLEIEKLKLNLSLLPQTVQYGDRVYDTIGSSGYETDGEIVLPFEQSLYIKVGFTQNDASAHVREVGSYRTFAIGAVIALNGKTIDECTVFDGALQLKNFEITCGGSTLEIEKRQLVLTIYGENKERVYADNSPITVEYAIYGTPAYGDDIFVDFKFRDRESKDFIAAPRNVGIYDILVGRIRISDGENIYDEYFGDGEMVFKNYSVEVEYSPAVLQILKKYYDIIIADETVTYGDAVPVNDIGYSVVFENGEVFRGYLDDAQLLVIAAKYIAPDGTVYGGDNLPVNAGVYQIAVDSYIVVDNRGVVEGGELNYDLHFTDGVLTIERSTLLIAPNDITVTYGDYNFEECDVYETLFGSEEGNYTVLSGRESGLKFGHKLFIKVGYLDKDGRKFTPKDIGEYRIAIDFENSVFFDAEGNRLSDGAANYRLAEEGCEGTLTIKRFVIDLDISDGLIINAGEKAPEGEIISSYNGKALPYNEILFVVYSYHRNGEVAEPDTVGEYVVKCNYVRLYNESGISTLSVTYLQLRNYAFNLKDGLLRVV